MLIWGYHDPTPSHTYYVMIWACLIAGFIRGCLDDWRGRRD